MLLGKLWTLLVPLGSIAFRMSLFSAAAGALAVALTYGVLRRLGVGAWAAATAGLIVAFAPSFWGRGRRVQRVYTLNAVFVALATAVMFDWHRTRNDRRIVFAALVCGLGATNHVHGDLRGRDRRVRPDHGLAGPEAVADDRVRGGRVRRRSARLPVSADPLALRPAAGLEQSGDAVGALARGVAPRLRGGGSSKGRGT